ncbi:MAG: HXXEE domain-containing protein [Tannerellaceae bacterium]|jgi:hypothetical protein|nr:HXXEE domain-containing protein [Tannerellaceae bacterium]
MNIELFVFLAVSLFMIHEFEELIFVRIWIKNNADKPKLAKDMWLKNAKAYPSTATIALMIGEEFLLVVILSLLAFLFHFQELAAGIFIAHTLHLAGHIANAIRVKRWSPGSITATATCPVCTAVIVYYIINNQLFGMNLLIGLLIAGIVLLANLALLHKLAPKVNDFILTFYRK